MIVGTLENRARYNALGEKIQKAFEWLENNDILKMEDGKYEIDGDDIFVWVQRYTSRTIETTWFESHVDYLDLHYVAEGCEYFGYTPIQRAGAPTSEYGEEEDDYMYERDYESAILLQKGDFVLVYQEDVHMPQRRALFPSEVVKACVKIKMPML